MSFLFEGKFAHYCNSLTLSRVWEKEFCIGLIYPFFFLHFDLCIFHSIFTYSLAQASIILNIEYYDHHFQLSTAINLTVNYN